MHPVSPRLSWWYPLNDRAGLDQLLGQLHPLWSAGEIRARVTAVRDETADTRSLWLSANRWWPGHRAGQSVVLAVEIDGVRHQRSYSLVSAPGDGRRLQLGVRRRSDGLVSGAVHRLAPGDVVTLSAPAGDFTIDPASQAPLLLLGAGSGMTPILSMLRDLARHAPQRDTVLVNCSRGASDALFAAEVRALAPAFPGLRVRSHHSGTQGRLDAGGLVRAVPDAAAREAFVCGPAGLVEALRPLWHEPARFHCESFGGSVARPRAPGEALQVRIARSERGFEAGASESLLGAAEAAGLKPRFGCRRGICHTCTCRKLAGAVEDLRTGEVSDTPDQMIQLCVSAARSDLVIEF